jgi:ribosomal protein S27AE
MSNDKPLKEITIHHVTTPLGPPKCPKCGEEDEVARGGHEDYGPYYWYCGMCGHEWGHV